VRKRIFVATAVVVLAVIPGAAAARGQVAPDTVGVELRASALLLPQNEARTLGGTKTVVFDDERVDLEGAVRAASPAAFATIASVTLQRRAAASNTFTDVLTLHDAPTARAAASPPAPSSLRKSDAASTLRTIVSPVISTYTAQRVALPANTEAIRLAVRRKNGSVEASPILLTEVRRAPRVLTLVAMGGSCTDPDANTTFKNLEEARIVRDASVCQQKSVAATFLGDLTPMASVNCNDLCNSGCTNFIEHLAVRLLDRNLANELQAINNPGTDFCQHRTNARGVTNKIVVGKWRNSEQEGVCGTSVTFNKQIDALRDAGSGGHVILIGQSQGGAKFADMVRDHWRWADAVSVDLYVSWDASSFTGLPTFTSNTPCRGSLLGEPCTSMGTRSVGSRPKKVLHFFQYHDPIPFQNGAPIQQATEAHDLNVCFSHNAIARSQFVHHTTADAVAAALRALRDAHRQ